jgi:threonine/homoserine/homoserine lactone efflux protein
VRIASGPSALAGYGSCVVAATPYWQRLLVLVPVFVVGIGLILGVLILLSRAFAQFIRESQHKNWIYTSCVVLVILIGILTYLGIKLPKEG